VPVSRILTSGINLERAESQAIAMGTTLPPPRCLQDIVATQTAAPDILLDTYTDSPNRFFGLTCRCGQKRFSILGEIVYEPLIGQDLLAGPVTAECEACRRHALLFDPSLHGFDVELDHLPPQRKEPLQAGAFECPSCKATSFTLTARFEYPARMLDALGAGQDAGYKSQRGREEDLFTFFTLIGRCSGCEALVTIASQACA
jgi:hypothetical protein